MMHRTRVLVAGAAALALALTACATDTPTEQPPGGDQQQEKQTADGEWFVRADYDKELSERDKKPEGPEDQPWLQAIDPEMVDTAQYKQTGKTLCFSNASVSNPWRVTGWITMQQQVN